MNFMILEIVNNIISGIVIYFTFRRVIHSDFVNRKTKCYFWKDIDSIRVTSFQSLFLEVKDGKGRVYNEKERFIEQGIFVPIVALLALWPAYVFLSDNFFTFILIFCFGTDILLNWYQLLIVYLRFKWNKSFKLLDENWPYNLNYTMFPLQFNRPHFINVSFYIFLVFVFNSRLAKIILVILLIITHVHIFMDKVDEYFGWNILKYDNLMTYVSIAKIYFYFFAGCGCFIMVFNFANVLI